MRARWVLLASSFLVAADGNSTSTLANNQPSGTPASTAVDVGHIFGAAGTDGLILYALILCSFMLFLALLFVTGSLLRSLSNKDKACAQQSEKFAEAVQETGDALRALAEAVATKNATEIAHQAQLTAVMARIEGYLARADPRNA